MKMYRQSREAALIYANSENELHKLKREKRLFIILLITTLFLSVLAGIIVLGALDVFATNGTDTPSISSALLTGPENTAKSTTELADKLLRLHVIANSDSEADQQVKLKVRNAVVTWLSENLDKVYTKEQAIEYINKNSASICYEANKVLSEQGFDYIATIEVGSSHFPGKVYGDFYLPAGEYDALRIVLGEGEGQNWWCIAFPALCLFGNAEYEDEAGKRESYPLFELVLEDEEYEQIQVETVKIDFKCKWLEHLWPF